ncbi:hypothetical protein [Sphingomonas faeni]|uniref:hypothetical protein n=1 Tax=Sphingomonas faeni TaxID=185950 RepID=UPI003349EE7A
MATVIAGPARVRPFTVLDIVIGIELFLLIVIASRTYTFFPFLPVSLLNRLSFVIPIACLPLVLVRHPYAGVATIGILAIVLSYQYWFASLWGTQFTGSGIGSYQALLLAPLAALLSARFPASRFVRIFFAAAVVHLFVYLLLYLTLDVNMIRQQAMSGDRDLQGAIRRTHEAAASTSIEYSDFKIGTSGAAMSFVVLYAISHLYGIRRLLPRLGMAVLAALSLYGMWVSDSRWNTASTLVALVLLAIPMGSRARAWLGFSTAALAAAIWIAAASAPFNPFSLSSDRSGSARALEFEAANPVLRHTLPLGIGLPNQDGDLEAVFSENVFIGDLGYYGDLLTTGLIGVALVVLAFWLIARFIGDLARTEPNERLARFLSAYLVYLAVVQIITPQLTSGIGGVFLSLAIAYLGRRGAVAPPPSPPALVVDLAPPEAGPAMLPRRLVGAGPTNEGDPAAE